MITVKRVGENFVIDSERARKLFDTNDLTSLDLTITHNCCDNKIIKKEFDFEFKEVQCVYKSTFCTFNPEAHVCIDPSELPGNCDNYFDTVKRIYVVINNEKRIIIDKDYVISDPLDMEDLKNDIEAYFHDEGYSKTTAQIVVTAVGDTDYCITISIAGLPNGVIPSNFIIGNDDPCFAVPDFDCELEGAGDCIEETASITLDKTIEGIYPTFYTLKSITINTDGVPEEIPLFYNFNYLVTNPTEPDFNALEGFIKNALQIRGYVGEVKVFVDSNHNFTVVFSEHNVKPLFINLIYPIIETYAIDNFRCTDYEVPPPTCLWKTEIIRNIDEKDINTISSLFIYDDNFQAPFSIITKPYDLSVTRQRLDFIEDVNAWFISNGYSGTIEVEITDSTITLTMNNLSDHLRPYSVVLYSIDNNPYEFLFYCSELLNLPEDMDYDPNIIEYRPDYIIVKPGFFGVTELKDGIYSFVLITRDENGKEYIEYFCYFVDDVVKCNIIKALAKEPDSNLHHYYESIFHVHGCNDCDCIKACRLFQLLLQEINRILNGKDTMCKCYNC